MENRAPQLLVAKILVRESQQRFPEEQVEARQNDWYLASPLAALGEGLRQTIAGTLVTLGTRIAGIEDQRPIMDANSQGADNTT